MEFSDWFLTADERGNTGTNFDRDRGRGVAWTERNAVRVHVDGRGYFARLYEVLCATAPGDWVYFTDWEGDADERLAGPGTEIADVLAGLAQRGVKVRGLLWRSHSRLSNFSEEDNFSFSRKVNDAGGQVLLDHRVRRGGSHHQKIVVVHHPDDPSSDVAFVGGIDLCHGRNDDHEHWGDPQSADLTEEHYGERPPWHDLQVEVMGPAVNDVAATFRERWEDPTPLDTRNPWRALIQRAAKHPDEAGPLAPEPNIPPRGPVAVQVLRTYPARRKAYPFAPDGERSIARAYLKVFARARSFIYLEDQYLWSVAATDALAEALRREKDLRLLVVIPRYPDPDGSIAGGASRFGRERVMDGLIAAGGDRVLVCDLENAEGTAIYVHSKICVVDDTWMIVGSDNLNRRSWTHDSEASCALLDETLDEREPRDPGGRGDGARALPRNTRLRLSREHLGRAEGDDDDLVDFASGFAAFRCGAEGLDAWHEHGETGVRPPGHVRVHPRDRLDPLRRASLRWVHAHVLDPDGRPRQLRDRNDF
jgi:phosphatidylserine/phosphatidylglycerophosphate/cardiolipin synthase-like enzyme